MKAAPAPDYAALKAHLNAMKPREQKAFAKRCKTSIGYLRKAISLGQQMGDRIVIAIERETGGAIPVEALRPDADWAYLRGTTKHESIHAA